MAVIRRIALWVAVLGLADSAHSAPRPHRRSPEAQRAVEKARSGEMEVPPDTLVVKTPSGPVRGRALNGTWLWRGIPFGKPPVGELRFAPPVA